MSTYLLINIAVIFFPLIFSFEKNIKFYKNFVPFTASFLIAGGFYIIWDIFFTLFYHWSFNPEHLIGVNIFFLPLEELLFFITIPYACLFLYETINFYIPKKLVPFNKFVYLALAVIPVFFAVLLFESVYTQVALFVLSVFLVISSLFFPKFLQNSNYWLFIIFSFIPFFVVNYLLTSIPVVLYDSQAITGIRITTIPAEDFIYSFTMLSLYLLIYLAAKEKWKNYTKQQ